MDKNFKIITESNDEIIVEFSIIKDENAEKPYGIYSRISGNAEDEAVARQRFFTYEEAVAVMDMLCKNEVTPCTMCDII